MNGYISSIQSLGTVDGPGVRSIVFGSGCPLACGYCHNPETRFERGEKVSAEELAKKLLRYKPYWGTSGGVTFSGGEPLVQAEFFSELAEILKKEGVHLAIDTSGHSVGADPESVNKLLELIDLALVDVKFTTEKEYEKYVKGSLKTVIYFLDKLKELNKKVWIRQVITPTVNDSEENIRRLKELLRPYESIIERVEFLPFRKLCLEKYAALKMEFPFSKYDEGKAEMIAKLNDYYKELS